MNRANQVAFPVPGWPDDETFNGMTIREHFAAMAMQGILANPAMEGVAKTLARVQVLREVSEDAVAQADALIAELRKAHV